VIDCDEFNIGEGLEENSVQEERSGAREEKKERKSGV